MLIESFLDYLQYERNYSEKTVLAYGEDIKQLQEFAQEEYGKFNPLEVEAELIREWIVSLMDKGYTSTSVNRKLSSLRTFYKYLLRQGETTIDPLRKIKGPKNKKPLPVFLKENEMNRLLDETDFGEGFKGCRDRLIIEMFYATGMRLSELIGLDDKDVDFSASLVKVTGKRINNVLYLSMRSWDARCENMSMCGMKLFRFARMLFLSGRMEKGFTAVS